MQSQGSILITVSRRGGGARGNVTLGRRAQRKSRVAGSRPLCCVDVCGPWVMARRVSALPSTCKHTHTHTHRRARAYQCWLHTGNAYPPARWVSVRPELQQTGTINVGFHVFHVLLCCLSASARPGTRVCVRRVRCLIRGKISCYFQTALFKRLLWCTKSDLKCVHAVCL